MRTIKHNLKKFLYSTYWLWGCKVPKDIGIGCAISRRSNFLGNMSQVSIGKSVKIEDFATLECHDQDSNLQIGDGTIIKSYAILSTQPGGKIKVGANCSINPFCVLYGHWGLTIGDNVRVATHTVIVPANHRFEDANLLIREQGLSKQGIFIGNDVWIGAGARILDGCVIGNGSVIGAGSVVTKDIPPYTVVAGSPARALRKR